MRTLRATTQIAPFRRAISRQNIPFTRPNVSAHALTRSVAIVVVAAWLWQWSRSKEHSKIAQKKMRRLSLSVSQDRFQVVSHLTGHNSIDPFSKMKHDSYKKAHVTEEKMIASDQLQQTSEQPVLSTTPTRTTAIIWCKWETTKHHSPVKLEKRKE